MHNNKEKLVEVFSGNLWQAEVVKGLLNSNNIQCAVLDESIGAVTSPYMPLGEAIVVVDENEKERALAIIESNSQE